MTPASGEEPELRSHPVDYEIDDLLALSKLVPRSKMQMARIAAGSLVILLFFAIIVEAWSLTGIVDWPALGAAFFVSVLLLLFANRRFRAWMLVRVARRNPLYAPPSYAITPGALRISSARGTSDVLWTAFPDVKRAGDRLFIFMSKRQAFIIPRRAFDSDEQFEAFAAAAHERWEARHTP